MLQNTQSFRSLYMFINQYRYSLYTFLIIGLYLAYRAVFKGKVFRIYGNYNTKLKNIGKPLPPYANGWYVALRSKDLQKGKSQSVDIVGENIVVFRSEKGQAYALEAYCKHLGANLGIGGKVVNSKCIQCPFHGWLYDGETGVCVDFDGKPMQVHNVEYNDDFCQKGKKLDWVKGNEKTTSLRKYPVTELNGYIYVWIHALKQHQSKPIYPMIDFGPIKNDLQYRATTIHQVKCHMQDIPQNGADILHFKYVHSQIIPNFKLATFLWKAKWKRGDDPNIKQMFEHRSKIVRQFKQKIYTQFIENYPNKQFLSIGYLDNFIKLPIFGHIFTFSATIIQLGSSTVFILLISPFFTIIFCHYLIPKQKYNTVVVHDGYTSKWLPYWISALAIKTQGGQVTNDMAIWEAKRFGRSINLRKGEMADELIKSWRQWYSQNYQGCLQKEKNKMEW